MRTGCIILAAGESSRLGELKQLVRLNGESLLDRAVRAAIAAGCAPILIVLGAGADEIVGQCDLKVAEQVLNPEWAQGMASSLRVGVAALGERVDAAIVMTCDQPAVDAAHLRRLIQEGANVALKPGAVASFYAGRKGVPAYLPAALFMLLNLLEGDEGARSLLQDACTVPLEGGELDVDTPESLAQAKRRFELT